MLALALTALSVAVLTWLLGWWGVVVAALLAGSVLWRRRGVAWLVALGAIVAWSALILLDATRGRFAVLSYLLGGLLGVPPLALVAVTLLFAALLAWSAAVLGSEIGRIALARRPTTSRAP